MAIQITVRGLRGGGKTHLIKKIREILRADDNYSADIKTSDGAYGWTKGPIRVVIIEEDGPVGNDPWGFQ